MNPIETSGIKSTVRVDGDRPAGNAKAGGSTEASTGRGSRVLSDDTVELTDTVSRLGQLRQEVAQADGVDVERVEAIRQQIADGSYEIDADRIADALVRLEQDLV